MELKDIDYPLPSQLTKLLEAMVDVANQSEDLTISCSQNPSSEQTDAFDYRLQNGGEYSRIVSNLKGCPLCSLKMLGFIYFEPDNTNHIFLTNLAFERIKYEERSWFGKLWIRATAYYWRSVVLVVTGLATFILVILQIAQLIGLLK